MKKLLLIIGLGLLASVGYAGEPFRIMFYNVENLFDIEHDSLKNDYEFLPDRPKAWTYERYQDKLNKIAKVIIAAGTDNVPGIAGMACAADRIYRNFDENTEHLYRLKERMAEGLSSMERVTINGMPLREAAPHIMSVTFEGIRSEVLLHALEDREIYVSAGSACSSHKRKPSAVLTAMGLPKQISRIRYA